MKIFFDIELSTKTKEDVYDLLETFFDTDRCQHIVTVNAEMLVAAKNDSEFKTVLQKCDLPVVDGSGPVYLSKIFKGQSVPEWITGSDVLGMLFHLADRDNLKIAFVGGEQATTDQAAAYVQDEYEYATIKTFGAGADFLYHGEGKWRIDESIISELFTFSPDIVAVALGHGKQEYFIRDFVKHIPSVRAAVGIGGALAFFGGTIKRAPKLIRKLGLEWLWRFIQEPWRYKRIFTAVIIFPFFVIWDKIRLVLKK